MNQPLYTIAPRGKSWAVLKWKYLPNGSCADTILSFADKQMAQNALARLNREAEEKERE